MAHINKISAVINTYNASEHLARVLDALAGFDEVIVCDMESTDGTVAIAQAHGCRVVTFPKGNHRICEPARDFAIHSASHDWVLVVDADEIVTPQLREYLYRRIASPDCPEALAVPRRNMLLGEYIHNSSDYQLRFLRKDKAVWPPVIHARPKIEGRIENIPANLPGVYLLHLDDAPVESRLKKMDNYSDYEVPKRSHRRYGMMSLIFRPVWTLFRSYVLRGGFRDGRRGIVKAYLDCIYQLMLLSKIEEKRIRDEEDKA